MNVFMPMCRLGHPENRQYIDIHMKHFVTRGRSGGPMTPYPWPTARPGGRFFPGGGVVEILPNQPTPPFRPP